MRTLMGRTRRSRVIDIVVFASMVLAILALLRLLPELRPVDVSGTVRVIDGDSIVVGGVEIRLRGIDAPEHAQNCTRSGVQWPCGVEAARHLGNHLRGGIVSCKGSGRDAHDRLLAVCKRQGQEINRWLVDQGWAVSFDDYPGADRSARDAKRGIWSGTFIRPRDWREENR